jgi:hypothetical protein
VGEAVRLPLPVELLQRFFHSGANLIDAQSHQGGEVVVALLALGEQAEHRFLVVAERHGPESLRHASERIVGAPVKVPGDEG